MYYLSKLVERITINMNNEIMKKIDQFLSKKIDMGKVIELFYEIGKVLNDHHFSYYQISLLDMEIRKKYGLIISLSKKNLIKVVKFYQISQNIPIEVLKKIDWNSYLILINKKNYEELIKIYIQNKMNKRELEYYLKTNKQIKITMKYKDPATDEFLKLQQSIIK